MAPVAAPSPSSSSSSSIVFSAALSAIGVRLFAAVVLLVLGVVGSVVRLQDEMSNMNSCILDGLEATHETWQPGTDEILQFDNFQIVVELMLVLVWL